MHNNTIDYLTCSLVAAFREQWLSILHHIIGIHNWTGNVKYHKCGHTPVVEEGDTTMYLEQMSPAFSALKSVVTARHLLKALPQLTKYCHTGQLEVYHSFLLKYCPKKQLFFYEDRTSHNSSGTRYDFSFNHVGSGCAVLFTPHCTKLHK